MVNDETQKSIKNSIRVFICYENSSTVVSGRNDNKYDTTVEYGYEDLNLHEDATKIALYQQTEYITIWKDTYRVVKREFQPGCPVMLCLIVEKV